MSNAAPGFRKYPDHIVAIRPAGKRIRIFAGKLLIADSQRALQVEESRHDPVYYLPESDVDLSRLTPTDTSTYCPFKGHASYWSVSGDPALTDSVWSYQTPYDECREIAGHFAFYSDRLNVSAES